MKLLLDCHPAKGPIKSLLCLSVFLSIGLSVCQFIVFLRNGSLVFVFCFMVDDWNI